MFLFDAWYITLYASMSWLAKAKQPIMPIDNISILREHNVFSGGVKDFRLMTKPSGDSKGCGFLEFDNVNSQQVE